MNESKFPNGWDQGRVEQLLKIHEGKSDEELADEDDAAIEPHEGETVIRVPNSIMPQIHKLLAEHAAS